MKKMMIIGALLLSPSLAAADTGVGISFNGNSNVVYVPFDVSERLRIEPAFHYGRSKFGNSAGGKAENMHLSVGVFSKTPISETMNLLMGARVGYLTSKNEVQYTTKRDGYSLAPTLGFEYFISENISLGGEVAFQYVKTSEKTSFGQTSTEGADQTSTGTSTELIARFYF